MKKILTLLLAGAALLSPNPNAKADVDFQDIGPTDIQGLSEDNSRGPFKLKLTFDGVGKAKVKDWDRRLQFATGEAEVSAIFYHNDAIKEGASIALSYSHTYLDWRSKLQHNFDQASLSLGFSSERLCNWIWQAQLTANFDNLEYWKFNDYMTYDMLLWGRYNYKNVGINIGFLGLTGMKIDRVYPIIGVDWKYNNKWGINLVFPTKISIEYSINQAWTAALAGRLFFDRHRLKPSHSHFFNKGLIIYTTAGAELAITYAPNQKLLANLHAGYDFGGRFKTANMHYHQKRNHNIQGAPYVGCELNYAF